MMEYWVAFMRDGKPSGDKLPPWQQHSIATPKTMVFGNDGISVK
jgi:carboxylesterase type B